MRPAPIGVPAVRPGRRRLPSAPLPRHQSCHERHIWHVFANWGATSHFTAMVGAERCYHRSKSPRGRDMTPGPRCAQMSKETKSVHCPVCNVSSPRDLAERERPSGQSCLICGTLISDFTWNLLATHEVLPKDDARLMALS